MYSLNNLGKDISTRENCKLVQICLRVEWNSIRNDNLAQCALVDALISLT